MHWPGILPAAFAIPFTSGLFVAGLPDSGSVRPPIVEAARNSDHSALRSLIQKKADVNAAEADGATALHWAAYRNDLEASRELLRAGARVNSATDLGATPLWLASEIGSSAMAGLLLEAGANPNAALFAGETPLMVAARSDYPEIARQLLSKGADINAHGPRGQTALMWAVSQMHADMVRLLIDSHADIHERSDVWQEVMAVPPHGYLPYNKAIPHGGETALMFAARVGDLASAKLLVAAGANVDDADAWGVSATTLAAHSGFREFVDLLLEHGADPNRAPNGFTALHEAIMRRDEHMVKALLEHHADPNATIKTWTPTRRASADWHFEPSMVGATPFWLAARLLEPGVMRLLAQHGADVHFVFHASWIGSQGTGQVQRRGTSSALLAALGLAGDNGNRDSGGVAPWVPYRPSERETLTLETVRAALELGVDVNATNLDGRTALDGAKSLKYASVVQFLTEHGAKAGAGEVAPARGRGRDPER